MKKYYSLIFLLSYSLISYAQCDGRYEAEIFDATTTTEIEYTDVYDWSTSNSGLDMDIYMPVGDDFTDRPVLVFAHGGSFYAGDKNNEGVSGLCESFAKRGYVTASIQYRLTTPSSWIDSTVMIQTVFNAISDMKSAVRYFRKDFVTNNNSLGIDTSQIFIGGYSAGAIIAVNYGFMNDESVVPEYLQPYVENAGGIEGNSGNEGYSSRVNAIMNLAGAVYLPSFIDPTDIPIVSVHAEDDETVAYGCDNALGYPFLPVVCGSEKILEQADLFSVENALHTFDSGGHAAPIVNLQSVSVPFISDFIYSNLDCNQSTSIIENNIEVSVFPNPFKDSFLIESKTYFSKIRLIDIFGKVQFSWQGNTNSTQVNLADLSPGVYLLQLIQNNSFVTSRIIKR